MTTNKKEILKSLYTELLPGVPVRYDDLQKKGISRDLAVYYVKSGWLDRVAPGIYKKPDSELNLNAAIKLLESKIPGLHVGGKTALEKYGIVHYLSKRPTIFLYGWNSATIPEWFTKSFKCEYRRKRLFKETAIQMLYVSKPSPENQSPMTSEPERALLEMLDEVGSRQTLDEAEELMEGAYNLRPDVMETLLTKCTSVKTVRLFLTYAEKLSLPTYEQLKNKKFASAGSKSNWVMHFNDRTMVLKP